MSEMRNRQQRSYQAGAAIARERLRTEAPDDAAALEQVGGDDILVVPGTYDHVEQVLDALALPYTLVSGPDLWRRRLRPEQLVVVNCPGTIGAGAVNTLRDFVHAGGSLFTTDWALRHVVEPGFPGVIAYNDRPTADDVVRIEIRNRDNPFVRGVMDGNDDPQWWLEGSSYPIRVLDAERVEVLLSSKELGDKYGETPVAVVFPHGAGDVFHMISHYYLQRTELRTTRHKATAASYAAEKGVTPAPAMAAAMADLSLGEVETAASSARLFANVVSAKKRGAPAAQPTAQPPAHPTSR